jgi:hypothetical protein
MESKEKARELVHRFQETMFFHVTDERIDIEEAKQCALIAVDEILFVLNELPDTYSDNASIFYLEVKQEIEKL